MSVLVVEELTVSPWKATESVPTSSGSEERLLLLLANFSDIPSKYPTILQQTEIIIINNSNNS